MVESSKPTMVHFTEEELKEMLQSGTMPYTVESKVSRMLSNLPSSCEKEHALAYINQNIERLNRANKLIPVYLKMLSKVKEL